MTAIQPPFRHADRVLHETWGLFGTVEACERTGVTWFCRVTFDERPTEARIIAADLLQPMRRGSGIRLVVSNSGTPARDACPSPVAGASSTPPAVARKPAPSAPTVSLPGMTGPAVHPAAVHPEVSP